MGWVFYNVGKGMDEEEWEKWGAFTVVAPSVMVKCAVRW